METAITDVPELFGNMVFNDAVMKAKLPKDVYLKLKDTIDQGVALDSYRNGDRSSDVHGERIRKERLPMRRRDRNGKAYDGA